MINKSALKKILIIMLSVAFLANVNALKNDAAMVGFQFLEEPVGTRAIAMGTAGTALKGHGAVFYNPALPALIDRNYLEMEYGTYPKWDLAHAYPEIVIALPLLAFSVSMHSESISDIQEVNEFGHKGGYFSHQFTQLSLTAAYAGHERFAIGLSVSGAQNRIFESDAYALFFGMGVIFKALQENLTLGASLSNLGVSTSQYADEDSVFLGNGENLPLTARAGIVLDHSIKNIPFTVALDFVYRNVRDTSQKFTDNIVDRITVPIGFEIKPVEALSLRMGKRINFSEELINLGIGLSSDPIRIDASFVLPKLVSDIEMKWLTSLTFFMRKKTEQVKKLSKIVVPKATVEKLIPKTEPKPSPIDLPSSSGGAGKKLIIKKQNDNQNKQIEELPNSSETKNKSELMGIIKHESSDTTNGNYINNTQSDYAKDESKESIKSIPKAESISTDSLVIEPQIHDQTETSPTLE